VYRIAPGSFCAFVFFLAPRGGVAVRGQQKDEEIALIDAWENNLAQIETAAGVIILKAVFVVDLNPFQR